MATDGGSEGTETAACSAGAGAGARESGGPASRAWRRCGIPGLVLLAILALALALRLSGVTSGLPYNFVNPDEGTIVPKAFNVARGHLNPHWFFYPSLYFYLLGALYVLATPFWWLAQGVNLLAAGSFIVDMGPYVLLGRVLSVAFGTTSVYLVYRLGRLAFGPPVGLLAAMFLAVEPLHVEYSHVAVTDVPATTFSLLALCLLVAAAKGGGRRWLLAGAITAGVATATKYNLGALVLPAAIAAVYACRGEVSRRVAAGARAALLWPRLLAVRVAVPMLGAFVLASPFVLLDFPRFLHDFRRQSEIMDAGWLGFENAGNGFWYNLEVNLAGTLGVVLVVLAVAGLALAAVRRRPFDVIVAPYVVAYFVYVSTWSELADRYLLPLIPLLLLFAARLCVAAVRVRPVARSILVPASLACLAAALFLPLSASIAFDRQLSEPDVRVRAKQWIEREVPQGSTIASDTYGPPLVRRRDAHHYREAGIQPVAYRLLRLKLPLPGRPDERHTIRWLRARDVEYVIVTSAVYDRVLAAPEAYPTQARFYGRIGQVAALVRAFRPKPGERGSVIKIYRLEAAVGG